MIIGFSDFYKSFEGDFMCKPLEKLFGKSAEYILETYGDKDKYPIDIIQIVERIGGIKTAGMDFSKLETIDGIKSNIPLNTIGIVRVFDNDIQIIYSDRLDESKDEEFSQMPVSEKKEKLKRRQRFTIAHELAHCCLHINPTDRGCFIDKVPYEEYHSSNPSNKSAKEMVANIFAGELLMPLKIVKIFLHNPEYYNLKNNDGKISIRRLADAFVVNNHVMYERIKYLSRTEPFIKGVSFDYGNIKDIEVCNNEQ